MSTSHVATKRKIKKDPTPKPSTLLRNALALFGPNGEHWIKGEDKNELDAGWVDIMDLSPKQRTGKALLEALKEADRMNESDVQEIISDELTQFIADLSSPADFDPKAVAEKAKELKSRFIETPAHIAFCSIGAVCEINTPNEDEAACWLAQAIGGKKFGFEKGADPNDFFPRDVITNFNDDDDTTWAMVKGKFNKAIDLAKAAGR